MDELEKLHDERVRNLRLSPTHTSKESVMILCEPFNLYKRWVLIRTWIRNGNNCISLNDVQYFKECLQKHHYSFDTAVLTWVICNLNEDPQTLVKAIALCNPKYKNVSASIALDRVMLYKEFSEDDRAKLVCGLCKIYPYHENTLSRILRNFNKQENKDQINRVWQEAVNLEKHLTENSKPKNSLIQSPQKDSILELFKLIIKHSGQGAKINHRVI